MTRVSAGVGTCNQPFKTLKASVHTAVLAPPPSAEALTPAVPAAPAVPPVMTEGLGSDGLSLTGVLETSVGNAVTWVSSWITCCAEVALANWPTHQRRNSRLTLGAAA